MAVDIQASVEAEDMASILGIPSEERINLFGDEPEAEVESDEESVEGEEAEESEEESEEEGEEEEAKAEKEEPEAEEEKKDEEKPNPVAENLKKALHAERAKRKEAAENAQRLNAQLQALNAESGNYKSAYESVVASIKEYGLENVVQLPKMEEVSPEVLEARKFKQQQESQENVKKFYDFVRTEATSIAPDYSEVNLSNPEHGAALTQIITAAAVNGVDREVAVAEGMKILNTIIATAKKEALKSRQPAVTPKAKPKSRTKQSSTSSKDLSSPDGISKMFADMGKRFATGKGEA
jgi:hypothetical protein